MNVPMNARSRPATSAVVGERVSFARQMDRDLREGLEQSRRQVARYVAGGGGTDAHLRGETTRGHTWLLPPDSPLRRPWRANMVLAPPQPGLSTEGGSNTVSSKMIISQPLSDKQLCVLRRNYALIDAKDLPNEECAICYAPLELTHKLHQARGDCVVRLPCGGSHVFHYSCIEKWLKKGRQCPTCRQTLAIRSEGSKYDRRKPLRSSYGQQHSLLPQIPRRPFR